MLRYPGSVVSVLPSFRPISRKKYLIEGTEPLARTRRYDRLALAEIYDLNSPGIRPWRRSRHRAGFPMPTEMDQTRLMPLTFLKP